MKIRSASLIIFAISLLGAGFIGRAVTLKNRAARVMRPAPLSETCPQCAKFGLVGITRGQTARLNVANIGSIASDLCRSDSRDVPPCS